MPSQGEGLPVNSILLDAHVHFYPCYDPQAFFQAAFLNTKAILSRANLPTTAPRVLCFTEARDQEYFSQWLQQARAGESLGKYQLRPIEGSVPMIAVSSASEAAELWLLPGRQINTDNGLEVSAYGLQEVLPDGGTLEQLVARVAATGAVMALPWGVGKWFGSRGEEIQQNLQCYSESVGVSDNANRPLFWPMPQLLVPAAQQHRLLAGSDPLPVTAAQKDVGRYGVIVQSPDPVQSVDQILDLLGPTSTSKRQLAGQRESSVSFVVNQVRMQLRKRLKQ